MSESVITVSLTPEVRDGERGEMMRKDLETLLRKSSCPHIAVCGGTNEIRVKLVKMLLLSIRTPFYLMDWDMDYCDVPALTVEPPFPLPSTINMISLISDLEYLSEEKNPLIFPNTVLAMYGKRATSLKGLERILSSFLNIAAVDATILQEVLRTLGIIRVLEKDFKPHMEIPEPPVRFDLSPVVDLMERMWCQKVLAYTIFLSRPLKPPDEVALVIDEGSGMAKRFLEFLSASARKRGIRLIYVSQNLPPAGALTNFVCFLSPVTARFEWAERLGIPFLPESRPDEFFFWDGFRLKRIKIK
ncbi:MAG: hypothetical protein QW394_09250 [Thermofilaceae archaeon]